MKHIVALLLAILMVLPLSLTAGATTTTGTSTLSAFEKQSVRVDLEGSSAGENKFSMDQYPYVEGDTVADMSIITLMEYGYNTYSSSDGRYQDYSLFLYVYNPGNVDVSKRDTRHAISLSIGPNEEYHKYPLKLLSYAGTEEHEKLLLKFKVDISADTLRELIGGNADRTYQVSEFEIAGTSDTNATTHVGGKWTYSGFQAGYGSKEGTLSAEVDSLYTIWVNPTAVTYRSSKYYYDVYYTQLDSVYFQLPKRVVEKYGTNIVDILYTYYAYESGWMVGFEDAETYELFKDVVGVPYTDEADPDLIATIGGSCFFYYGSEASAPVGTFYVTDMLSYIFQYDADVGYEEIIETDVKEFYSEEWRKFCNGEDSHIFSDKEAHFHEVHMKPSYEFNTWDGSFWDKLFGSESAYSKESVPAIQIVTEEDLSDVEGRLFIDDYYADDLKVEYGKASANGNALVVFHFAESEYKTAPLEEKYMNGYSENGFVANETIYMDFDMIEMTFEKDGQYHVLPVSMSPINVVSDLQTPGEGSDWPPDWLVWVLVIVLIVVGVVLLVAFAPGILTAILQAIWFVLKMIVKGIVFLLRLIIKGIVALCKGIGYVCKCIALLFKRSGKKKK